MKKTIFLALFTMLTIFVNSQPTIQMGVGASSHPYASAELSVGYNFGPLFLQAGYLANLTRNVDGGTYLNAVAGHHFPINESWWAEPGLGYAYILKSTDHKELNADAVFYSATVGKDINSGSILLKACYAKKTAFVVFGIRYNF